MFRPLLFRNGRDPADDLYPRGAQRPGQGLWELPEPLAELPIRRMNKGKAQELVTQAAQKIFELGRRFIFDPELARRAFVPQINREP